MCPPHNKGWAGPLPLPAAVLLPNKALGKVAATQPAASSLGA